MYPKTVKTIVLFILVFALALGSCAPAADVPSATPAPSIEPSTTPEPSVEPSTIPEELGVEQISYLQSADQVYIMATGILFNNLKFCTDGDYTFTYDFDQEDYTTLIEQYKIDEIAGEGSDFERAARLMADLKPRLTHKSDYDNHIETRALPLLEYALDNPEHGINCLAKSEILNEMYLALGIYSRKVWLMPYSRYDNECHAVNEIWDRDLGKWIMIDVTNGYYWVDSAGTPLSILEIRSYLALDHFCTPIRPDDARTNYRQVREDNFANVVYIAKNMAYLKYCLENTAGSRYNHYALYPQSLDDWLKQSLFPLSQYEVERSPIE